MRIRIFVTSGRAYQGMYLRQGEGGRHGIVSPALSLTHYNKEAPSLFHFTNTIKTIKISISGSQMCITFVFHAEEVAQLERYTHTMKALKCNSSVPYASVVNMKYAL